MKKIRKPSAVPLYGTALVWALYCLIFPLYKVWHFLPLIALGVLSYFGLSKLFPGVEVEVEEPEPEPESTGDPAADALIREGEVALSELRCLRGTIRNAEVQKRIDELSRLTKLIFDDIRQDPSDIPQIKRFASYYLPTTMKLLNAYDRMAFTGADGKNVAGTLEKIEDILDTTVAAYKKQYDSLFANEALDIETDITVLESMMKREGLTGSDFGGPHT